MDIIYGLDKVCPKKPPLFTIRQRQPYTVIHLYTHANVSIQRIDPQKGQPSTATTLPASYPI